MNDQWEHFERRSTVAAKHPRVGPHSATTPAFVAACRRQPDCSIALSSLYLTAIGRIRPFGSCLPVAVSVDYSSETLANSWTQTGWLTSHSMP